MEVLTREGASNTPTVLFDHNNNLIEMGGDSMPENAILFFDPLFEWLNNYGQFLSSNKNIDLKTTTICNFKFEYFNSSTAKCLMDIILKLEEITTENNVQLSLNWHYDEGDEDMKESGEEMEDIVELEFNFFPMKE